MKAMENHLFYNGTEGYLGETSKCRLLFLMREPNCGEGKIAQKDEFWFRKVVQGEKSPWSRTYFSKLGQIAALILNLDCTGSEEEWRSALKQAIYINVNPVSGKGQQSKEYKDALKILKNSHEAQCAITVECDHKSRELEYPNRWNAILNMPSESVIVTVGDVYTILLDWAKKQGKVISESLPVHLLIKTKGGIRSMRSFVFSHKGRTITVLETLHPAARRNNYYQWKDISLI